MASRYHYWVYGLTLASDVALSLPEAGASHAAVELALGAPELFRHAEAQAPIDSNDWIRHAALADGTLYVRWENWFEILVSANGRRVLCHNLSGLPLESFEAYLTNFAVSAALVQQGEETLHATAVEIGGRVIGLLGPSGAGKSTLAAYLISRGGKLVTDDMLRLTFEDDNAVAQPGPQRIKLFKEPADRYLPRIPVGYWNPAGEKMIFEAGDVEDVAPPRPLSALFRLDTRSPGELALPVVEQLGGFDLLKAILSSNMNYRLQIPGRSDRQFHFAERLAKTIPLFRLTYTRHFNLIDQAAARIYESAPV